MISKTGWCAAIAGTGLMLAASVHADTAQCTGRVTRVVNHTPGSLYVALEGLALVRVCDFDAEYGGLSPSDCKHIASLVSLALATDRRMSIWIDNAPTAACSSIPAWHSAQTRAVELHP